MVARWIRSFRAMLGRRQTVRAHFWQSMANYAQQGFGVVLGVVLARLLGPQDFGEYAFALATISLALLPATWSIAPLLLADHGRTPGLFSEVMGFGWFVLLGKICLSLLVAGIFFALGSPRIACLVAVVGSMDGLREIANVLMYDLHGRGEFKYNFWAELSAVSLSFLFSVPAALDGWGAYALLLPGFAALLAYGVVFYRAARKTVWQPVPWRRMAVHFQQGFWLWVNNISQVAFGRMDNWFVGQRLGADALGFYNRAYNYSPAAHLLLSSFLTNPTISALAHAETPRLRNQILYKTTRLLVLAGIANMALLYFLSDPLVVWVFGEPWRPCIPLFKAFSGFSLCTALFYLPITLMLSQQRFREVALVRATAALIFGSVLASCLRYMHLTEVCYLVQSLLILQAVILWAKVSPDLRERDKHGSDQASPKGGGSNDRMNATESAIS